MIWLLDLIDDHRAAVKYDLLRHGYRLEWLGTDQLPWGDAHAILAMQPPAQSAVYRELRPKDWDRTRQVELLEQLAVILVSGQMKLGNWTKVTAADLPGTYEDLFDRTPTAPTADPERQLYSLEQIDALVGWNQGGDHV